MKEYNIELNQNLDLVLFKEACQHICRISRILIQPRGNVLLIGVGGCGKQTLTKMASYITGCQISSLGSKKTYTQKNFREDISEGSIRPTGVGGQKISLIINDNQITNEIFLEDINSLLNSGEIPNLWENEQRDEIMRDMRDVAKEFGVKDNLYNFFIQRVRDNLHIVLCLSPVGESLKTRIRMFPSLVNCCAIDWFDQWPEEALHSISTRFISQNKDVKDAEIQSKLSTACVYIHKSVEEESEDFYNALKRKVYITPKSYLDFISSYSMFLDEKNSELSGRRNTLFTGLNKLEETNKEVARLSVELVKLKPILEENVIEQEKLSKKLEKDKVEANKNKAIVEEETRIVEEKAMEIKALQKKAQDSLDEAIPALENAQKAVNTLNQSDIAALKTVNEPTQMVLITFTAVAILLEERTNLNIKWTDIKKMLASDFFGRLKSYDKDQIPPKVVTTLDKFVDKHPNFVPEEVGKSNKSGESLCSWARAILTYTKVVKQIEPLRQHLASMNDEFQKADSELKAKQDVLNQELAKVDELKKAMNACKANKEKLDKEIDLTQLRLERAEKLTVGLADEHKRWGENIGILDTKIRQLVGDVFISAACISYYGPFTGVYRNNLTDKWLAKCKEDEIESSETFGLEEIMGDPMTIMDWQIDKLPADSVSICNAIMIEKGLRKPFLIDPQLQGTTWLKNVSNRSTDLQVVRMSDPDLLRVLETSIKMGYEIMIEDMPETIDPLFEPIITNDFIINNSRKQIRIGDKLLDYDPLFKIYFITNLANPHFLPEIFIRVTIINFTVTEMGLSQQLLAEIVKIENADVEAKKNELTLVIANDNKRIKKLEDDILRSLANSSENILDDEQLVANLDASKVTSDEISKNLEDNKIAQVEIEQARSQYKGVADRGCALFFIIASLSGIDSMYQYSLNYFTKLFKQIITHSEKSDDVEKRVTIMLDSITELIYLNICRGLFNTHKLIFSFLIAFQILKKQDEVTDDEWNMLLKGVIVDNAKKEYKNPLPDIISQEQWLFIMNLEVLHENFTELPEQFERNKEQWKQWIQNTKNPTRLPFPGGLDDKITSFQRLLIFKALKSERLSFLCREFVDKKLGKTFSTVKPVSMKDVYEDSDNKAPLTFILTQGADPTYSIIDFAKKIKGEDLEDEFYIISLGQGQDKRALKIIAESLNTGKWVMLQNCHLYKSFMGELENQVLAIQESEHHEDFRLILTSMPRDYFPISVLQNSIKITSEPPKGLKANLLGNVRAMKDEFFESCQKKEELKKFAFSICVFHAIVHERKKFGPLGWNIVYDFNESDLVASQTIIKDMIDDDKEEIAWDSLQYLTGEIMYGGKVTDGNDRRCLMSILQAFINPAILEEGYSFSSSGIYKLPFKGTNVEGMVDYVQTLPEVDSPEIFGMNENADIACLSRESNDLLKTVLSIQSKSSGSSSAQNNDKLVDDICQKIKEDLPESLSREGSAKDLWKVNKQGLVASLTTYLLQEIERFNNLITVIDKSLDELRDAIKGLVVMSDELDMMYNSILINKVPDKWEANAYPSLKPLSSWTQNLCERIEFIRSWLAEGRIIKFWMPCFFFPQGFLTAILQEHARRKQIPIDELSFSFSLVEDLENDEDQKDKATIAYIVYGLFLESGNINTDTMMLEDAALGKNHTTPPPIKIIPTRNHVPDPLDYSCPLYKTSERYGTLNTTGNSTNFILMIELPSSFPPDHWIKRGTALLCQLDN